MFCDTIYIEIIIIACSTIVKYLFVISGIQYTFYLTTPINITFRDITYKKTIC